MGSDNPGGGGTGSTTRWLVVLGIVSLVALLYVLLSGGRASVDRPRLRAPGPDVGPAAAQRQLDEQVQLVYAAQDAAQSCRTQFQDYAVQAAASINQCNDNIRLLNDQAVSLDAALRACEAGAQAPSPALPVPAMPSCPPPEVRIVEKIVEVEKPAPTADAGAGADSQAWLVFGLPSVPRKQDMDYLSATIDFILDQLPADPSHPLFGKVKIVVMNNAKGRPHKVFDDNKRRLDPATHPKGSYVVFKVNPNRPRVARSRSNNPNVPSAKVQQQSADVIHLVRNAAPLGAYYMFMEDDFRLCPRGMLAIQSLMEKATRHFHDWIVLRVSFGLNGALLHSADALAYVDYLEKHIERRPPDHMLVEWFAGEKPESATYKGTRPHIAFRYNLFEHLGDISTLRTAKTPVYAACYEQLLDPVLFEVEAFKPAECGHQDMWPCPSKGSSAAGPVIPWKNVGDQIERIRELPPPSYTEELVTGTGPL